MGNLGWAGSWLLVLAIGLAPILLYWAGRSVRRKWLSRRLGRKETKASERK